VKKGFVSIKDLSLSLSLSLSDEGAEDARGFGLVRDLMGLRKTRLKSMSNGG
jgi:hypothetical protein